MIGGVGDPAGQRGFDRAEVVAGQQLSVGDRRHGRGGEAEILRRRHSRGTRLEKDTSSLHYHPRGSLHLCNRSCRRLLTIWKINAIEWQSLARGACHRSEEHTSEIRSLMRISYAVLCLKTKNNKTI